MGEGTKIPWTDATWNPITGCSPKSEGCRNCYAKRMATRLKAMGLAKYGDGFKPAIHPGELETPLRWQRPRRVFVGSMGDLFHEDIPTAFIADVFKVMADTTRHTFQVLTKRSERMVALSGRLPWAANIWMGVSVENAEAAHRIDALRQTLAAVKFVSFEPLLGSVFNVDLAGTGWCVCGGENGPGARPMDSMWAREIRAKCERRKIPFFMKQMGAVWRRTHGGDAMADWPEDLRVRQFPEGV